MIELFKMVSTPVFVELATLQRHQTKLLGKQQRFLSAKVTYKLDKIWDFELQAVLKAKMSKFPGYQIEKVSDFRWTFC